MENKNQADISLFSAIVIFTLVGLLLIFITNKKLVLNNLDQIEYFWTISKNYISALALFIFFNFIVGTSYLRRLVGLSKQGAKLRTLKREAGGDGRSLLKTVIVLVCGAFYGWLLAYLMQPSEIQTFDKFYVIHTGVFAITFSFFLRFSLHKIFQLKKLILGDDSKEFVEQAPSNLYSINLGTELKKGSETEEAFVNINERALYGSILITGSKGSGKTSGALLPYLKQIANNFSKKSMLLIDPKRTFVKSALKILREENPETKIRVLTIGDDDCLDLDNLETINPVYMDRPLKQSRFINIAEMVRACSVNFSKSGSDSPFWEISSFNLLKNIIVYCAAKYEYFTIKDIYEALISTSTNDFSEELLTLLGSEENSFDEEESFNIRQAAKYFELEYRNLDDKVKSGIMATSTLFINQFQEYRASAIFCPLKDKRTILSLDSIIDNGEILALDISSPALARAMGTMIKLLFEQSNLDRLADPKRKVEIPSIMIGDEIQDTASVGDGMALGDESFLAKCREAKVIVIGATQSLVSLENKLGSKKATEEYIQNYRTRIAFHSGDIATIKNMQELVGKKDIEKESRSISEISNKTERNFILGGFDSSNANISESMSISSQKDYELTGREFTDLNTFEAWALIFDGVSTDLKKLFMKPLFLEKPETPHSKVLAALNGKTLEPYKKSMLKKLSALFLSLFTATTTSAFPNICNVINQPGFKSCLQFKAVPFVCSVAPPEICVAFSYYVPQSFIETTTSKGLSHFSSLTGAALQLSTVKAKGTYGAVNDDSLQSFQGRTIAIPLAGTLLSELPCEGERDEKLCFDGMSEHFDPHWSTGKGDLWQPKFLAWKASPKACMIKGALTPGGSKTTSSDSNMCSYPRGFQKRFMPSSMPVCTNWGVMYPRYGSYVGGSEVIGSLAVASRIKSLSVEVLSSMPSSTDEKWSMISPNYSNGCFKEFDPVVKLESYKAVNNRNRIVGKNLTGNLYSTWKRVSCVKDIEEMFTAQAYIAILQAVCKGVK